jgi:hypothetical protein
MIQVVERACKGQLSEEGPDARTDVQASGLVSQASDLVSLVGPLACFSSAIQQ